MKRTNTLLISALLIISSLTALPASTDTWVGASGNNFSPTANWTYSTGSGPVASGDSLLFSGAGSTTPNNDLTGFTFGGVSFSGTTVYTVGGNPFTLGSGGSIANSGAVNQIVNNDITLTGSGGVINPSVASASCGITLGGVISGGANLTKSGGSGSTLTLTGVNTFSGVLTLNAGTVLFTTPPSASGANLGNPSGITFGGSSTTTLLTTPGAGSVTISYPTITANSSSTAMFKNGAAAGTIYEISARVTGAGNCKQNTPTTSGAIVRFSNDGNDYTGVFSMAGGIVEYTSVANGGSAAALGGKGTGTYAVINSSSAATLRYVGSGSSSTTRNLDWQGTTGALTLDSGPTASGPSVSFLGTGNLRSGSGNAMLTLTGSSTGANTLGQTINNGASSGTTSLTKSGAGTWVLSGANGYSGGTTISAGTLQLVGSATLGASGSAVTVSGGTLDLGGTSQTQGAVAITGSGAIKNGTIGGTSYSASVSSGTALVSANLGGSGAGLTHSGAGTLALLGVNTYTAGTVISGSGMVLLTNDSGLGDASGGITFSGNGALAATNNAAAVNSAVTVGSSRTITVNSGVTANFYSPDTNNLIVAARVTGPGNVLKRSSSYAVGAVRFSNDANDYTGDFTTGYGNAEFTSVAEQGTASALGAGATVTSGQITLNNASSSGTLRYIGSGNSATHRPLVWTGTTGAYTLDASGVGTVQYLGTSNLRSGAGGTDTLYLRGSNTGANTLAQVIADLNGATSLIKNDAGTWVLTALNTYTGSTTVNHGILLVSGGGSLGAGSAVSVGAGAVAATLGGDGIINGPVTVGANGTLAPGASIGTLSLGAPPNLGGTLAMEIDKAGDNTTTADKLALGANDIAFGGALTVTKTGSGTLANGDSFPLFETTGSKNGWFTSVSLPSLPNGLSWDTNSLATTGVLGVYSFSFSGMSLATPKDTPTKLSIAKLLSKATTSQGAAGLSSVSPSSANGGNVSSDGTEITFAPATGSTAPDSFTCVLTDGHGTIVVTVNVTITDPNTQSPNIVSAVYGAGVTTITVAGRPGVVFGLEYCTDLGSGTWLPYGGGNQTVDATGVATFIHTEAPSSAFYRTVYISGP